jgi:hypothetical protein
VREFRVVSVISLSCSSSALGKIFLRGDSLVSPFERTLGGDSGADLCGIEDVLL